MPDRQRVYRTSAVVLRRRNQGDADRVLTLYTPGVGKLELLAKGVRKTTSRKAGHLEPFTHVALMAAKARTWDIVTEAQTIESFRHLRESLDNISRASYVCEIIDSFSEADDENQPLWDLLLLVLRELDILSSASDAFEPQVLLRWFEIQLLSLTGFQPQFFYCLGSGEDLEPLTNYLSIQEMGVFSPRYGEGRSDTEPIEPDVLKVLRYLQSNRWVDVRNLRVRAPIMVHVESILYRLLIVILERQLKSVDFLRKLRALP